MYVILYVCNSILRCEDIEHEPFRTLEVEVDLLVALILLIAGRAPSRRQLELDLKALYACAGRVRCILSETKRLIH